MNFKTFGVGVTAAFAVATGTALVSAPAQAAILAPGAFTITGDDVSRVTGFSSKTVGSTFTLNLDNSPLSITDKNGVFAGISGLTGTPNVASLLLTVVNSTTFSFGNKVPFITGLKQNGENIFFDLDAGNLGGFINSATNYSFGGSIGGKLRDGSGNIIGAGGSVASFDIGSGPNSNRSSITVETIPTPALLPGLIAMGAGVLRKRKAEVEAVEADA